MREDCKCGRHGALLQELERRIKRTGILKHCTIEDIVAHVRCGLGACGYVSAAYMPSFRVHLLEAVRGGPAERAVRGLVRNIAAELAKLEKGLAHLEAHCTAQDRCAVHSGEILRMCEAADTARARMQAARNKGGKINAQRFASLHAECARLIRDQAEQLRPLTRCARAKALAHEVASYSQQNGRVLQAGEFLYKTILKWSKEVPVVRDAWLSIE